MYSVDTNVFIDWWERRYPPDVFPSVQKAIEDLVSAGKLFAPERVREEINSVGSSALKQWIKNNKNILFLTARNYKQKQIRLFLIIQIL